MAAVKPLALVTLIFVFVLGACRDGGPAATARATETAAMPTVAVTPVRVEDLADDLVLSAEFLPFQEVEVMAKVSGYVQQMKVDVGDHVRQGQLLARLEVPEMLDETARARATLERSRAEVSRARMEVTRAESAGRLAHLTSNRLASVSKSRPGLVAQQEVDDALGRDQVAEAQLDAARSSQTASEQAVRVSEAELEKVKTLNNYLDITAPFAGVVTKRYADNGSLVQAGTASHTQAMPVVRVSENSLLRLVLPVPESAVPSVKLGEPVEIHVSSLNRSFTGHVARFADKILSATRTMETEVDVPNPQGVLVSGMFAEARIRLVGRSGVPTIPVTAYDPGDDPMRGTVLIVNNGRIERRAVRIGLETANRVEVQSGLVEGDLVVVGMRSGLKPGTVVTAKNIEEPKR